jgi:hypothetical protein
MTKKKTKPKRFNYKTAATELASCVLFALKYLDTKGGSGLTIDAKTRKITRWQDDFMKALDGVGYVIDRDDYWKVRQESKKQRRR